ncbi:MAG TPA: response regulator [Myxococcaceae bacterium]|nr:response regulator [Myxococcaceae bacterium]
MPAHVLVIEDDPDVRREMVSLLEAETPWVKVSSAGDGMEALEILDEEPAPPCLVLLDLMMPVMNGLEFLEAARARGLASRTRVVLVSGYAQLASHVKHPDVAGMLSKPFRAAELLELVHRHCADGGQG